MAVGYIHGCNVSQSRGDGETWPLTLPGHS